MRDKVRETDGGYCAHPRRHGFLAAAAAAIFVIGTFPARADVSALQHFDAFIDAFAALDRHEIAALVLTFGVLLFAVMAAIILVRTRMGAASAEAAFRDRP